MAEGSGTVGFTVSPTIRGWPYQSFAEFKKFAVEQTGEPGIYWFAIHVLMERSKRLELYEGVAPVEEVAEKPKPLTLGGD